MQTITVRFRFRKKVIFGATRVLPNNDGFFTVVTAESTHAWPVRKVKAYHGEW